jgi:hypothetical protein
MEKRIDDMTAEEIAAIDEESVDEDHPSHVDAMVASEDGVLRDQLPLDAVESEES